MKNFNQSRNRNFNDRGSNSFGDRSRGGAPTMHKAICSECGKDCQLPFKPTGSKPVFCSNCFADKKGPDRRREDKFERSDSFKPRFDDNKKALNNPKMDEIISRLDQIIKLLSFVNDSKKELEIVEAKKEITKAKDAPKKKVEKKSKVRTKAKTKK
jgi:CxxC-x17-CxxC domain-containing protein